MAFLYFVIVILFYALIKEHAKIQKWIRIRRNLNGIKSALNYSDSSKSFYIIYLGLIKSGNDPYIKINIEDGVVVPDNFHGQETICLDISPNAIRNLKFEQGKLLFKSQFNAAPFDIAIPISAIMLIYSEKIGVAYQIESAES